MRIACHVHEYDSLSAVPAQWDRLSLGQLSVLVACERGPGTDVALEIKRWYCNMACLGYIRKDIYRMYFSFPAKAHTRVS